jgi:hypothetical protein
MKEVPQRTALLVRTKEEYDEITKSFKVASWHNGSIFAKLSEEKYLGKFCIDSNEQAYCEREYFEKLDYIIVEASSILSSINNNYQIY